MKLAHAFLVCCVLGSSGVSAQLRSVTPSPYLPQTNDIANSFTTPPTALRLKQINDFVSALVTAGVWTKLDFLHVMAAADSQAATINWVNPGTRTLSAVGSVTFSANSGFQGSGGYLSVGVTYNALSNYSLNSAHQALWVLNNQQEATFAIGASGTTNGTFARYAPRNLTDNLGSRLNDATTSNLASVTDSTGFYTQTRSSSAGYTKYKNASSIATPAVVSTAVPDGTVVYLRDATTNGTWKIAVGSAGSNLNSAEILAFYNAAATYLTEVGAIP